jgi:hypothetical protein
MTVIYVVKKEKFEVERDVTVAWNSLLSYILTETEDDSTSQKLKIKKK